MSLFPLPSYGEWFGMKYYLNCKSSVIDMSFKFNRLFKEVTPFNINQKMNVLHWSGESINTEFPYRKSIDSIVPNAKKSEYVSINFNRVKGTASFFGTNPPTKEEIKQCKSSRGWGCNSHIVTDTFYTKCVIVDRKY